MHDWSGWTETAATRTEWAKLDHVVIVATIRQWHHPLTAFVKAGDGHSKHCLWLQVQVQVQVQVFIDTLAAQRPNNLINQEKV